MQEVGTRTPAAVATSKIEEPAAASTRCPLIVRVADMLSVRLPRDGSFELGPDRFGDGECLASALLLFAPLPLGEVVVSALEASLRGKLIDSFHEARRKRQRHLVPRVLRLDLGRNLLPVEDLVGRDHLDRTVHA